MNEQKMNLIKEMLLNNESTFDSLTTHLKNNPGNIDILKKALILDSKNDDHNVIMVLS